MSLVDHTVRAASAGDYIALLKPRVMSLVVFTALVGYVAAPGAGDPVRGCAAILALAVAAGGAGALNMWYDADIDAVMTRTRARPVPSGRIAPAEALALGLVMSFLSVLTMALAANVLAAALLAFTIFFYAVVYTMWLKRTTPHNIVIGGLAGALPPAVAWAAKTGALGLDPLILTAIIFMWTPPHFWALALSQAKDYAAADVPMLPVTHGEKATRSQILIYALLLAPLGLAPSVTGLAGPLYAAVAAVLGAAFVLFAARVRFSADLRHARALFAFSIFYLFALFAALFAESLLR
ncbi:MAG: protoheme IX farnesyltransferase [Hydrogenophilaceae bacterium]|nr:protoheme IX farnesyltransferase [Hydrogenophilaceae bacterium]